MGEVTTLATSGVMPHTMNQVREMESAIMEAIKQAKLNDVPQGLIVALLHGHTTRETLEMLE